MILLGTTPLVAAALLATPAPFLAPPSATSASPVPLSLLLEAPDSLTAQPMGPLAGARLTLEAGAVFSNRNDVRSPGDTGTRFSLNDLTGEGPWPLGRVTFEYDLDEHHALRLLYAPVRTDGTGELQKTVRFEDETFAPGRASARYRFDTYRLAYRYRFWQSDAWEWRGGVTALVRDASIEVSQGGRSASKANVGVVPLLNLTGEWRFADRWVSVFDFEGSAAPQGRAFDVALTLGYEVSPGLRASVGYRTIEGGADNDEVYTFTWVNSAIASLRWTF